MRREIPTPTQLFVGPRAASKGMVTVYGGLIDAASNRFKEDPTAVNLAVLEKWLADYQQAYEDAR